MSFFLYLAFIALTYLRPVEAFAQELQVYRPMVVLGLIGFAAALVHALSRSTCKARPRYFVLIGGLLLCISLSKITNGWMGGVSVALSDFSTSALLFLIAPLCVTSFARIRTALIVVAMSTLTLCVWGIVSYHTGYMADRLVLAQSAGEGFGDSEPVPEIPAEDNSGRYLWRVRHLGFLSDPNDFGQVIVIALPMLTLLYRPKQHLRNLMLVGIPVVAMIYTLFLTHSRGAILGVAAVLFFAARKRMGSVRSTALICIMLAGFVVTNAAGGRAFSTDEESAGGRILAWSEGLAMLSSHPVFGIGYGDFGNHFEYTAHNSYVLCFAELGLVGYFIWLAMIINAIGDLPGAATAETEEPDPDAVQCATILRLSMVGFLTCAYFLSRTYAPPLFLLLGLCVVCAQCARDQDGVETPRKWAGLTGVVLVASIALIYVMVIFKHST
jgi:hypothetical protein